MRGWGELAWGGCVQVGMFDEPAEWVVRAWWWAGVGVCVLAPPADSSWPKPSRLPAPEVLMRTRPNFTAHSGLSLVSRLLAPSYSGCVTTATPSR